MFEPCIGFLPCFLLYHHLLVGRCPLAEFCLAPIGVGEVKSLASIGTASAIWHKGGFRIPSAAEYYPAWV